MPEVELSANSIGQTWLSSAEPVFPNASTLLRCDIITLMHQSEEWTGRDLRKVTVPALEYHESRDTWELDPAGVEISATFKMLEVPGHRGKDEV